MRRWRIHGDNIVSFPPQPWTLYLRSHTLWSHPAIEEDMMFSQSYMATHLADCILANIFYHTHCLFLAMC